MCANVNWVTRDRTAPASIFDISSAREVMGENASPLYGTFTNDYFFPTSF